MQGNNPKSTFGPDLNEFSQNVDFSKLDRNSDFIYLRASGFGTGKFRVDKKFIEFAKECRKLGKPSGAYHYAVPSKDLKTADIQCDEFINILQEAYGKGDYGDLFPVLDVETPLDKSLTTTQLVVWVERFKNRFEARTRRRLMLYTGLFFIELYDNFYVPGRGYPLSVMPLWIAMYTDIPSNPSVPPNIGGWTRWTVWQFTEKGKLEGVSNPVDLNWGPDSIDKLVPPANVKGLTAYADTHKIYVSWKPNTDVDLVGYNIFVNANYAGTVLKNISRFVIDKSRFYLPHGKPIEISIEAFDSVGDFSRQRTKYIIK